jgi:hypothetical protein
MKQLSSAEVELRVRAAVASCSAGDNNRSIGALLSLLKQPDVLGNTIPTVFDDDVPADAAFQSPEAQQQGRASVLVDAQYTEAAFRPHFNNIIEDFKHLHQTIRPSATLLLLHIFVNELKKRSTVLTPTEQVELVRQCLELLEQRSPDPAEVPVSTFQTLYTTL